MNRQYKTADGSIWETNGEPFIFIRVDSPDGSHEEDFRPQKLDEVLTSWGPLSLYDPIAEQIRVLTKAFDDVTWFGCQSYIKYAGGLALLHGALDAEGYEIRKKET